VSGYDSAQRYGLEDVFAVTLTDELPKCG